MPINNNSKQNHHVSNWNSKFHGNDFYNFTSSESLEDDETFKGGNINNCKKNDFYDEGHSTTSDNSLSPRVLNGYSTKLVRHFSDTSLADNRKKHKGTSSKCYYKHKDDFPVARCSHHCHKFKDGKTGVGHKNFCKANHANEKASDDSFDSIYNRLIKVKQQHANLSKKHHKCDSRKHPTARVEGFCNCNDSYKGYHDKTYAPTSNEFFQNCKVDKPRHWYGKDDKESRNWQCPRKNMKSDLEDFQEKCSRKRTDYGENLHIIDQNKHHVRNCYMNNMHNPDFPPHHKQSNKQFNRGCEKQNAITTFKNFKDNFETQDFRQMRGLEKENIQQLQCKHRHTNEFSSREDFNALDNSCSKQYSTSHCKLHHRTSNQPFDRRVTDYVRHGRCHRTDARHLPLPYHVDLDLDKKPKSPNKRMLRTIENHSLDGLDNERQFHHCRHKLYANKTQNAKDSARHRRCPTPIVSSTTYTVHRTPLEQNHCNGSIDKGMLCTPHKKTSNRTLRSRNFTDEGDSLAIQKEIDMFNYPNEHRSKDKRNEFLREFKAKENLLMTHRAENIPRIRKKVCNNDFPGKSQDFREHCCVKESPAKSSDSFERLEVSKLDRIPKKHSRNCWKRMRCSRLYDISESDES